MQIDSSLVIRLFEILNKNYKYAVLRGYDDLPENFKSHDIDILIEKNDFERLKQELKTLFESLNFKILMVNENERFNTFVIAKRINNDLQFLYLDFFFNYSLYGVKLLDASNVLERREFNEKVYHVSIIDEFLEKFLNTSLLNHPYPDKYYYILQDINKNYAEEVKAMLIKIFNDKSIGIEECQELSGKKLLLKTFLSNLLHEPVKQIKLSSQFIYFYIKGWMNPNGFSFSVTGPDGSSNTKILTQLEETYSNIYREVTVNYDKPHYTVKTDNVISWFRLLCYISDYIKKYYKVVKPVLFRRGIVIFDRYYTDIISDSKHYQIHLNYKIIFMLRKLVPNMDHNFIIFVDPDLILQRKQSLTREQIDEIYEKLNYICEQDKNHTPINNDDAELQITVNSILDHILEEQNKKYQRFFK